MKQIIEFKKDCIMKSYISEITNITLTHDYKIMDNEVEGIFDVSGEYKITKSSVETTDFSYKVPFSIALSDLIDKDSINITIEDFKYTYDKDMLHLVMDINMAYEEKEKPKEEKIEEEKTEEEKIDDSIFDMIEENAFHSELLRNDEEEEDEVIKEDNEEREETKDKIKSIVDSFNSDKEYYKYKVYIVRKEDTIESIAIKYNVSLNDILDYNDVSNINIGDKIIIPFNIENE